MWEVVWVTEAERKRESCKYKELADARRMYKKLWSKGFIRDVRMWSPRGNVVVVL